MQNVAEVKAIVVEAAVWVEAAIRAAEALAKHGIVPSCDFELMMDFLHKAAETLRRPEGPPPA